MKRWTLSLAIAPAMTVMVYFAAFSVAPSFFRDWLQGEYGIVETATAALFVCAGWCAWRLAVRSELPTVVRAFYLVFTVVALFVALEEISWGQQLIGWHSPKFFEDYNQQSETNLHNLLHSAPGKLLHRIADAGSDVVFIVLPVTLALLGRRRRSLPQRPSRWSYYVVPGFELVLLALLTRTVALLKHAPNHAPDLNELRELLWSWEALGYVSLMRSRLVERSPLLALPSDSSNDHLPTDVIPAKAGIHAATPHGCPPPRA